MRMVKVMSLDKITSLYLVHGECEVSSHLQTFHMFWGINSDHQGIISAVFICSALLLSIRDMLKT